MNGTLAVFHAFMASRFRGWSRASLRVARFFQDMGAWLFRRSKHHDVEGEIARIRLGRRHWPDE